ncbi:MAG: TlpA family protein disulfide reductase [Clostridia bacterium]|nr:TlpA family protein disulfide reductase [Clostridia bacterium]
MLGRASPWARAFALVLLAATAFAVFAYRESAAERAAVGRAAPDFALPALSGGTVALADLRGRPAVVDFFASWCEVCELEAPVLETFFRRYGQEASVVAVDWREPAREARSFRDRFGLSFPVLRDADGQAAKAYGLTGVPESWVLAPDGTAVAHFVGGVAFEDLRDAVARAAGAGWREGSPLAAPDDPAASIEVAGDGLVVRRASGAAFESDDGGLSWQPRAPSEAETGPAPPSGVRPPEGVVARAVAVAQGVAYLVSDEGVFVSVDGGRSWKPSGFREPLASGVAMRSPGMAMLGEEPLQAWGVALAPSGSAYFAARSGIWVTAGPEGPAVPLSGSPARAFRGLAVSGDALWALAPDGDLYVTRLPASQRAHPAPAGPRMPDAGRLVDAGGGWYRVPVAVGP